MLLPAPMHTSDAGHFISGLGSRLLTLVHLPSPFLLNSQTNCCLNAFCFLMVIARISVLVSLKSATINSSKFEIPICAPICTSAVSVLGLDVRSISVLGGLTSSVSSYSPATFPVRPYCSKAETSSGARVLNCHVALWQWSHLRPRF
jgi:hypothetical protein